MMMRKALVVVMIGSLLLGVLVGCSASVDNPSETQQILELVDTSTVTLAPEPTPKQMPEPKYNFVRNDVNPASWRVATTLDYVYFYTTNSFIEYKIEGIPGEHIFYDIRGVTPNSKWRHGAPHQDRHNNNHVFVIEDRWSAFCRRNDIDYSYSSYILRTNAHKYGSLVYLYFGWDEEPIIDDIQQFIKLEGNYLYYLSTHDKVFVFNLKTQEKQELEDYYLTDDTSLPEDIWDVTQNYTFKYTLDTHMLEITPYQFKKGKYEFENLIETLEVPDYGELVALRAINNSLYFVFKDDNSYTKVYYYNFDDMTYTKIYATARSYEVSLVKDDRIFFSFKDDDIKISTLMYIYSDNRATKVFDGERKKLFYSDDDSSYREDYFEYIYEDISYLVYKGGMLFGYHIDDKDSALLVLKTDFIDPTVLQEYK